MRAPGSGGGCGSTHERTGGTVEADRFIDYQRAGVRAVHLACGLLVTTKRERLGQRCGPGSVRAARLANRRAALTRLMHGLLGQTLEGAERFCDER